MSLLDDQYEWNKNKKKEQCDLHNVSNSEVCSGCGKPDPTVDRYMFDGMCGRCTDIALFDYDFAEKAKKRNRKLM